MKCTHRFKHTPCTRVCVECGLEERSLKLDSYNAFSAPLCKGYRREVRFRQKIDKLIHLQNAPPTKCPVWEYLASQKPFTTPSDIRKALRRYGEKNKHYDSIRLFTRVFTPFRVVVKRAYRLSKMLNTMFARVVRLWNRYNLVTEMNFFSYDYLTRVFLEHFDFLRNGFPQLS